MLRRVAALLLISATCLFAQKTQSPAAPAPTPAAQPSTSTPDPAEYLATNFGHAFALIPRYPVLAADLDGDGIEDAVFVVTGKDNPLVDELQYHYKVIDPYDDYFGFGDPRITLQFNAKDPAEIRYLAIVHSWRSATPKAKFVVINLPFETLTITRIPVKKKTVAAIGAEELGGLKSAIYWDGKRYRWDAQNVPME
jgi:hypothetical protein